MSSVKYIGYRPKTYRQTIKYDTEEERLEARKADKRYYYYRKKTQDLTRKPSKKTKIIDISTIQIPDYLPLSNISPLVSEQSYQEKISEFIFNKKQEILQEMIQEITQNLEKLKSLDDISKYANLNQMIRSYQYETSI